jgi:predicted DNA-binding transcriptional regulator YafY
VSRLQQVTLLDTHFRRTDDFDLPTYWQDHIQDFLATLSEFSFTLRIDSRRMASSRWYTPGRVEIVESPGADGWLTARFWVESLDLATSFVLTMGTQVEIVEPDDLRQSVLAAARDLLNQHATEASSMT